jgi:DNA mismatch endonuclease (patch repair protein)
MPKRQKEVAVPRFRGVPSSETASKVKQLTPRRDTAPELLLRRALWARGLRYRTHLRGLAGRPDVVFTSARVAVFCDGDFWHGKDWDTRRAKLEGGANGDYWVAKIAANMARDQVTAARLTAEGWRVLRFWESEILADVGRVADAICAVLPKH